MDNSKPLDTRLRESFRSFPDFPEEGIDFKDICPLFQDPALLADLFQALEQDLKGKDFTHIVALESRGFLLCTPLGISLQKPVVLLRKPNKLPGPTIQYSYKKEYGPIDTLVLQTDALTSSSKCLILDDLLATGGTAMAAAELVQKAGASVWGYFFLVELEACKGREKLEKYSKEIHSKVHFRGNP